MSFQKQLNDYYCGPSAIQAALYAVAIRSSQRRLAQQAETTKEGTSASGILTALSFYPVSTGEFETNSWYEAWGQVDINTSNGYPTILCVDHHGHWVTVVGSFGDKFQIWDPQRNDPKSGSIYLSWKQLNKYWRAGVTARVADDYSEAYYGITVVPKYQDIHIRFSG